MAFKVGKNICYKAPLITTNAKILRELLRAVFEILRERFEGLRDRGRRIGKKQK